MLSAGRSVIFGVGDVVASPAYPAFAAEAEEEGGSEEVYPVSNDKLWGVYRVEFADKFFAEVSSRHTGCLKPLKSIIWLKQRAFEQAISMIRALSPEIKLRLATQLPEIVDEVSKGAILGSHSSLSKACRELESNEGRIAVIWTALCPQNLPEDIASCMGFILASMNQNTSVSKMFRSALALIREGRTREAEDIASPLRRVYTLDMTNQILHEGCGYTASPTRREMAWMMLETLGSQDATFTWEGDVLVMTPPPNFDGMRSQFRAPLKASFTGASKNCPDARRPADERPERTGGVREDRESAGNTVEGQLLEVPFRYRIAWPPEPDTDIILSAYLKTLGWKVSHRMGSDGSIQILIDFGACLYPQGEVPGKGFKHPVTREIIPYDAIDSRAVKRLVKETRRFFRERIIAALEFYHASGDDIVALSDYIADDMASGDGMRAVLAMDAIINFAAPKCGGDGFDGAMRHRFSRLLDAYRQVPFMIRKMTEKIVRHRSKGPVAVRVMFADLEGLYLSSGQKDVDAVFTFQDTSLESSDDIDFETLEEILDELFWNAVKYCDHEIRVEWDEEAKALSIINDGPGIPEGVDPFVPGDRAGRVGGDTGGGYGLSNALEDAHNQGWEITYESRPGRTVFKVSFKRP